MGSGQGPTPADGEGPGLRDSATCRPGPRGATRAQDPADRPRRRDLRGTADCAQGPQDRDPVRAPTRVPRTRFFPRTSPAPPQRPRAIQRPRPRPRPRVLAPPRTHAPPLQLKARRSHPQGARALRAAMSCLEVMYQVYGTPQPYFAAAYAPYHQVRTSGWPGRRGGRGSRCRGGGALRPRGLPGTGRTRWARWVLGGRRSLAVREARRGSARSQLGSRR